MCGIICYKGNKNAVDVVIEGLKKLEYRGYDSWGIAARHDDKIIIKKQIGKISNAVFSDGNMQVPRCKIAMGHTRWATHGAVTQDNAHPHTGCNNDVAVVHNGIIENFQELKKELAHHEFSSETDSELIAHLIEDEINSGKSFGQAFRKAISLIDGRFAIVAMCRKSDKIIGARKGSPLILGLRDDEYYLASDVPAFLNHTNKVVFLDDGDIVTIQNGVHFTDFHGNAVARTASEINWNVEEAELGAHEHFMIKEILEQKETINKAIEQDEENVIEIARMINQAFGTFVIGCGTAGKVGMVGSYIFSKVAGKHINHVVGSEFPNYHQFLKPGTLVICISQSGETADTLEAIEVAKAKGCKIVSIVNVEGSTMTRMSDRNIQCKSGPEKAVCSTKVTTAQIAIMTLLAYACAGRLEEGRQLITETAAKIRAMIDDRYLEEIKMLASRIAEKESMYIIGRGLNYPMALEAAIKLQEVPYIHAEGFAGGELKHGPIALIQKGVPCIALVGNDEVRKETIINALEIRSRGGYIIGVAPGDNDVFDYWIPVPDAGNASPIVNIIPMQILSYYTALERGLDADKPRNLAKSVTVK